MIELWLVRHGETDWNLAGRFQGQTDIPLNEAGRLQALELARKLDKGQFGAIYSSDLKRAAETAGILSERLGLPVTLDRRLREICFGKWEGQLAHQVRKEQPMALADDPLNFRAPGGETLQEVSVRMATAADEIAAKFDGQRVWIVAHGMSLAALICLAEGQPLTEVSRHVPQNCAIRTIRWGKESA
jgi:probable phosphoglycerate mutase